MDGVGGFAFSGAEDTALLALCLLMALAFEFVNGFHDTANAVATVIYTNSLKPMPAVIWSAIWNYLGAFVSSGAVAFGIVALLPPDLALGGQPVTAFMLVFSLLAAALFWNFGTWLLGLPTSSSHALIGAILGVSLGYTFFAGAGHVSGMDWTHVYEVGLGLVISPIIGFVGSALLQKLLHRKFSTPVLEPPAPGQPVPPWPVRLLLIAACTGVSFAHGSNDGQKGMGLLMLVLIAFLPGLYAVNPALGQKDILAIIATGHKAGAALAEANADADILKKNEHLLTLLSAKAAGGQAPQPPASDARALRHEALDMLQEIRKTLAAKPAPVIAAPLEAYRQKLSKLTEYLPAWVKLATACVIALGTMIGWRRIVITIGEKIGQQKLTASQGISAGLTTAGAILGADMLGLPVSTTHILSSGVAGTMVAESIGLKKQTVQNILAAWILTLPATVFLGSLFFAGCFYVLTVLAG